VVRPLPAVALMSDPLEDFEANVIRAYGVPALLIGSDRGRSTLPRDDAARVWQAFRERLIAAQGRQALICGLVYWLRVRLLALQQGEPTGG
jgi:hypothetical protein